MQHIWIKNTFRTLLAGLVLLAAASAAPAAQIEGSIALSVNMTTADTADVTTATSFSFSTIDTDAPSDGDFASVSSGLVVDAGPTTLALGGPPFILGSLSSFGQFAASTVIFDDLGNNSRSITLMGSFVGGTLFPSLSTPTDAILVVGLTQTGGVGRPISASFTLVTMPLVVPEPSSLALCGIAWLSGLGYAGWRRKRAA